MTVESSLLHSDSEDIFAKSIERVEAGESIEAVLATVPVELHTELREILLLITATHHVQRAPVPQPTADRRAARKAAFLQAAAQMQAEIVAEETARTVRHRATTQPVLVRWFQTFWRDLQLGFAAPNLRLAPLVTILVAVWLSAFGFFRVTQAAELGEVAYSVNQWIQHQEIKLSPPESRPIIYQKHTNALVEKLSRAAARMRAEAKRTGRLSNVISTEELVFDKTEGNHLILGPLTVLTQYQPDPNVDAYADIHMPVMPSSAEQVNITFQLIPTEDENAELPFITQGITLTVPERPIEIGPTPTSAPPTDCVATYPETWVPYAIRDGDTLSDIAQRTGSTVSALQTANCIKDINNIVKGTNLFTPGIKQVNTPTATEQISVKATLTAISTTVVTPSVNITATASVVLTDTSTLTPTETLTDVIPADATVTVTATTETTATVGTPTPTMTTTATVEAVGTMTATITVTGTNEPSGEGTPVAPTVTVTTTSEAGATPVSTISPTADGTATSLTPTETPTPAESSTATATATRFSDYTETPTPLATPTLTPEPTNTTPVIGSESTLTSEPRQNRLTPTSTPIPQNRSPLIGG